VDSCLFQIPFNGTLHDFKGFQFVNISVSFCDLGVELHTHDLIKFLRHHLFQDIFKMAGLAPASKTFIHSLHCGAWRILAMCIHGDRVELLYCFVWNYRKPGKNYLLQIALNLLLCGFCLFMFCWTPYYKDLEKMKKNRQNIRQNGHWKLETYLIAGLQLEGAHNNHSETVIY